MKTKPKRTTAGFTLIEVVIAIAIVAFGITGLMFAMASGTRVNEYSSQLSDSVYLSEQIGAVIDTTSFDNLKNLNGQQYDAVDSNGNTIEGFTGFKQSVSVLAVNPLTLAQDTSGNPQAYLVTVSVTQNNKPMTTLQWLKVKK